MQQVSAAYIMGVKEGRAFLKQNPDCTTKDIQAHISNIKNTLKGFSGDVAEILRGELDFWKNQIKQKESTQ